MRATEHSDSDESTNSPIRPFVSERGRESFNAPVVNRHSSPIAAGLGSSPEHLEFIEDLRMQQRMMRTRDVPDTSRWHLYLAPEVSARPVVTLTGPLVPFGDANLYAQRFQLVGSEDEPEVVPGRD
jgi:hypothetical protein